MKNNKHDVFTFKADVALSEALKKMPNRSAFIRRAVLQALDNVCPLCQGTGVLSPEQKKHWQEFASHHQLVKCEHCHELHLVCANE